MLGVGREPQGLLSQETTLNPTQVISSTPMSFFTAMAWFLYEGQKTPLF